MDEDSPEDLAADLMSATIFGDQSLGMPILGPASRVSAYTRDDLAAYKGKHYSPKEAVLSLSGNYDPDEVYALCLKHLGSWQPAPDRAPLAAQAPLAGRVGIRVKDTEQTHLCMGFPGLRYGAKGQYELNAVCGILGGAMTSRLFQRIREEMGACYTIYSYTNSYDPCGTLGIYAGVNPSNAERVLDEIRSQIALILRDGFTEKELRDCRTQMRASLLMGQESPGTRMQLMGRSLLLNGSILTEEERLARIDAMTMDSVMEMARRVLSADPCYAVVGPDADRIRIR